MAKIKYINKTNLKCGQYIKLWIITYIPFAVFCSIYERVCRHFVISPYWTAWCNFAIRFSLIPIIFYWFLPLQFQIFKTARAQNKYFTYICSGILLLGWIVSLPILVVQCVGCIPKLIGL